MKILRILLIALFALAALVLTPSCGTRGWPVTGSISFRDQQSGAKAGMVFEHGAAPRATVKVPIYDKDSGELVGMADLTGEIPVRAEK